MCLIKLVSLHPFSFLFSVLGFPGGSDGKESVFSAGDLYLIPGLGISPGEGNGYLLKSFNGPEPGGPESIDKKVKERERG